MSIKNYFIKSLILGVFLFLNALISIAQTTNPLPLREEKILNGLRLLVWSDPKSEKVSVKIRLHSGAAFDPLGREGVMQMLAGIIFPNESTKEFFTDDLGGNLEITCNYDYIQISASGDADKFLTIVETLSAALNNPQINKEMTEKVRAPLLAKVKELEKNPAYIADQAVANRLFGNFPYGRPQFGSSESLAKIDFADLIFARERFLTADNATVAISGNVKSDFALKASKRLFGGWLKSDKKVPSTFAQPDLPKTGLQVLDTASDKTSELRFALRSIARNDKDYYASQILESIIQNRLRAREGQKAFVRQNIYFLPGFMVLGVSEWKVETVKKIDNQITLPGDIGAYQNNYLNDAVNPGEFETARKALSDKFSAANPQDQWLDWHTYKFVSVKDDLQNYQNVSQADVQRLLEKLQKEAVAAVLVVSTVKPAENSVTTN